MIKVIPRSQAMPLVRTPNTLIRSSVNQMQKVLEILSEDDVFSNPYTVTLLHDLEGAVWIKGNKFKLPSGSVVDWKGLSSQSIAAVLCTLAQDPKLKDLPWVFASGLFKTEQIPTLVSIARFYDFTIACLADIKWDNYPELAINAQSVDGEPLGTCSNLAWYAQYN